MSGLFLTSDPSPIYLLKTNLSGAAGQPLNLAHGAVLDTLAEGMDAGMLQLSDTVAATMTIESNTFKCSDASAWNNWAGMGFGSTTPIPRAAGRVFKITHNTINTGAGREEIIFGLDSVAGRANASQEVASYSSSATLYGGLAATLISNAMQNGVTYQYAYVLNTTGYLIYAKGGQWGSWTLIYTNISGSSGTLHVGICLNRGYSRFSALIIPNALYPDLLNTGIAAATRAAILDGIV